MENKEEKGIFNRIYTWFSNITVKGLLGVILVAFIIIIILLTVSYLPGIISRVSSSLSAALYSVFVPAENATITTNKNIINSGEDFVIDFKRGDLTDGFFTVSYACDFDIDLFSIESNGLKKIECDIPYYLLEDETNINIKAITEENLVRLVMTAAFENNATLESETIGVVRVTVKNDSTRTVVNPQINTPATSTVITNPVTPYVPSQPAPIQPIYYGKPDLAVRVLQIGRLTNGTNFITSQNQFTYSDMVGIKFEIRNDGDANTGPWAFTAVLPSVSTPTYSSNTQISLRPGESIVFTLGFSDLTNQRTSLITINADPQNLVSESIEYNNIVTSTITNNNYNSNYYDNNYNNNGCYVNGIFTYNCLNQSGYYDQYGRWISYNNYDYNDLRVSCYADPDDPETDDRVRWYAEVDGGNSPYNYDWTGTNGLDSSSRTPSKTYTSRGWKYATVTVTDDDDYEVSTTCSVYVD